MTVVRLALSLAVFALAVSGCVSEEDLIREWDAHVDAANECTADTDCALVYPGCPLGCFAVVHPDQVEVCRDEAARLIRSYESTGRTCDYDCPALLDPYCDAEGRCAVDVAP